MKNPEKKLKIFALKTRVKGLDSNQEDESQATRD